jgi:hypothetical protein
MDSSRFLRGTMCRDERGRQATNYEEAEMDATTVAIDLAKDIFEVAVAAVDTARRVLVASHPKLRAKKTEPDPRRRASLVSSLRR